MTFGQFLAILRARWRTLSLVFGITVAAVMLGSLLLPKQYTATASVVVDFKPDPISAVMFGGMASPAFMATQVDIIQSERVAQRVVRNLRLGENAQIRQQWLDETNGEGGLEQWLGTVFQRYLEVKPSRESSVISVSYRAQDPRFAAALANAFVQAYVQTALELRVDPARQYAGFFDERGKAAKETLENAQRRLSAFQQANGIIATDERFDVENARLTELSSQLVALQAIASESSSRQAQANAGQGDRLQEVLNNGVIGQLKADINRGEGRLQELSTRLGDANPQVLEARANLQELRTRLDAETRRVTSSVGISNRINRQREGELRAALESQRAKVLRMKAVRDEGLGIVREVDNALRAYDAVQARLTQTSLEGQSTQSNVNVLTQAEPPLSPSSPRLLLNAALAVFFGLILAIGIAMVRELRDRRVRSADDVFAALQLPVIGVMLRPGTKNRLGRKQVTMLQQRLLAPSTSGAKGI